MKAALYDTNGGPEVMRYGDAPDPHVGEGQVLVRVEAISIEGGDLMSRRLRRPAAPGHIVGYAAAGEIVDVGPGVEERRAGQKVATFGQAGSHASLRLVRADHCWVLPAGMNVGAAAAVAVGLGTAHLALFELARLQAGETVLVQGAAGGVGLAAVQLAKRAGARVIGTGSSAAQLEALRPYGLDNGIVYGREDVAAAVRELTEKRGVDVAVDPIGGATLSTTIDCLGFGGRAVLVGLLDQAQPSVVDARLLLMNGKSLIGGMLGTIMHTPPVRAFIQELLARVHSGELTVAVDRVFPLAEAAEAHRYAETRGRSIGRVLITP